MISILTVGIVLFGLSVLVGCLLPRTQLARVGDKVVVTAWAGLLLCSSGLMALSVLVPLGNGIAALILLVVATGSALRRRTRQILIGWLHEAGPAGLVPFALLLVGLAILAAGDPANGGDYALYHYPVTRWFTEYGTVPGLTLLHTRFGTAASWWTLNAVFNVGPLTGRISPFLGFLSVGLLYAHVVLCATRVLEGRAVRADWFLLVAVGMALPFFVGISLGNPFTDRADSAVAQLGILLCWLFLALEDSRSATAPADGSLSRGTATLLMVVSAGAVTLKLSAAPLLLVTWCYLATSRGQTLRDTVRAAAVGGLVFSGFVVFSMVASGCPLYPAAVGCLDLPTGVGAVEAKRYASVVTNFWRWGTEASQGDFVEWLAGWVTRRPSLAFVSLGSLMAGVLGFVVSLGRRRRLGPEGSVFLLGALGVAYGLVLAPSLRFFVGSLPLVPAMLVVLVLDWAHVTAWSGVGGLTRRRRILTAGVPALMLLGLTGLPTTVFNVRSVLGGRLDRAPGYRAGECPLDHPGGHPPGSTGRGPLERGRQVPRPPRDKPVLGSRSPLHALPDRPGGAVAGPGSRVRGGVRAGGRQLRDQTSRSPQKS